MVKGRGVKQRHLNSIRQCKTYEERMNIIFNLVRQGVINCRTFREYVKVAKRPLRILEDPELTLP